MEGGGEFTELFNDALKGLSKYSKAASYHMLKSRENKRLKNPPIEGGYEMVQLSNNIKQLLKNTFQLIHTFKKQFNGTVDPLLLHTYADNYLWLRNLALELHRIIAPTESNQNLLAVAKSLGVGLSDSKKFNELSGPDIDGKLYYRFIKCPSCDTLLNTGGHHRIICPNCTSKVFVQEQSVSDVLNNNLTGTLEGDDTIDLKSLFDGLSEILPQIQEVIDSGKTIHRTGATPVPVEPETPTATAPTVVKEDPTAVTEPAVKTVETAPPAVKTVVKEDPTAVTKASAETPAKGPN